MRSSMEIPILLFLFPFFTLALPLQRRAPTTFFNNPEAASGASVPLADAANAEVFSRLGLSGTSRDAPSAPPARSYTGGAQTVPPTLLAKYTPEEYLIHHIQTLWNQKGEAAAPVVQGWLDAISDEISRTWRTNRYDMRAQETEFDRADQRLKEVVDEKAASLMDEQMLAPTAKYEDVQAAVWRSPAVLQHQQELQNVKNNFQEDLAKMHKQNNYNLLDIQQWLFDLGRQYGTKGREAPAPSMPQALPPQ